MRYSTIVGIDTHARKNSVCALDTKTGEITQATLSADPDQLVSWIEKGGFAKPVHCVYESGPTGFGLARALVEAGVPCTVAAASKLPRRTDKQKNDKRDAQWLARMAAAGSVRAVYIPTPEQESLCHLSRLRDEAARDLKRARQRVASFLLLTRTSYTLTKKRWTKRFYEWSAAYEFPCEGDTFAFRSKVNAALRCEERLREIEDEMERAAAGSPDVSKAMERLLCIHGIGKVTAFALVCEVYDFHRFSKGSAFASFVGLVPSESSSGAKEARGPIAKTGNSHLRRLLMEAAGCYSNRVKAVKLEDGRIPEAVRAKVEKCASRLKKRRERLRERKVPANKAKVAVARELCEWIYYIMVVPA